MDKIKEFIKKYNWIWIIVIVIIAIVGDALLNRTVQKQVIEPTPTPKVSSFRSVTPGVSTEADLNKVLGTPVRTTVENGVNTNEYKSTSELRLHNAVIENGKVVLIKEIVSAHDTTTASSIIDVYGKAPNILYSQFTNATFQLYVYPASGIAYLGHEDGTLLEIWYFMPTTIQDFMGKWAQDYSFSKPTEQEQ